MLDTFIREIAKQPYLVYSEEFSMFVNLSGDQLKTALKQLARIPPSILLDKY